jgi:F-type H+-transporting ATPase subunit b
MSNRLLISTLVILFVVAVAAGSEQSQASEQEGQEGIFNGTLADSIWAVIAFLALLIALRRLAWKPLLIYLKNREEYIQQQLSSAENTRLKAEKMLDESKQQSLETIEKTIRHATQAEKEIIEKASNEAISLKDKAVSEINYLRDTTSLQLWQQVGDILLNVCDEVLGRSISSQDNQRLINEAISRLQKERAGSPTLQSTGDGTMNK